MVAVFIRELTFGKGLGGFMCIPATSMTPGTSGRGLFKLK
jgi:hypothetical protein